MTELMTILNSVEFGEVRTVLRDGEPWFVAADVCKALGHTNVSVAVDRLDDDERAKLSLGRQGETNVVSESGLYSLILRSNKPEARGFRRWITHEVLPTLRKQGYYSMIKDEDLIAIISERRKQDATYLLDSLVEEREKLNAERYEQLKEIWNTRRFDLDLKEVDKLIDEIWHGDAVGADEAKKHYRELYYSRFGLSHIYGTWKDPKKPKQRKYTREKELIEMYEHAAMRDAVETARNKEFDLSECEGRIGELSKMDQITLQGISKIVKLRTELERMQVENEAFKTENEKLKAMLGIAVNE